MEREDLKAEFPPCFAERERERASERKKGDETLRERQRREHEGWVARMAGGGAGDNDAGGVVSCHKFGLGFARDGYLVSKERS